MVKFCAAKLFSIKMYGCILLFANSTILYILFMEDECPYPIVFTLFWHSCCFFELFPCRYAGQGMAWKQRKEDVRHLMGYRHILFDE